MAHFLPLLSGQCGGGTLIDKPMGSLKISTPGFHWSQDSSSPRDSLVWVCFTLFCNVPAVAQEGHILSPEHQCTSQLDYLSPRTMLQGTCLPLLADEKLREGLDLSLIYLVVHKTIQKSQVFTRTLHFLRRESPRGILGSFLIKGGQLLYLWHQPPEHQRLAQK